MGLCIAISAQTQPQQNERYKIQWHDHTLYTNRPMPAMPTELTLAAYPDTVAGYYFVQFSGPVKKNMKSQVTAAGGELLIYLPNNCFLVKMNAIALNRVRALSAVQWVGIYQPAMRLSEKLMNRVRGVEIKPPQPQYPLKFEKPDAAASALLQLTIVVFKNEDLEKIRQAIAAAGGTVLATSEGKRQPKLRLTIARENALALARINGVMWLEEFKMPRLHNDTARGVMNITPVWTGHGLRGNGQIIGISDTGLDMGVNDATMHDDVEGRIINIFSWAVQAGYNYLNAGDDDGASDLSSGHGTHTTGSILGNGTVSGGTYSGVAPNASLVFQAVEQFGDYVGTSNDGYFLIGIPINLNDLFLQAYNAGARIHSNSWGAPDAGAYTATSQDVDEFVWDHPDMLILFSAGNDGVDTDLNNIIDAGSVGAPGTAKNCLTVGASENNRPAILQTYFPGLGPIIDADQIANNTSGMAAFSSRGPTDDGRFKPDLVAPGTMVASLRSHASPNTVWFTDDMESGLNGWTMTGAWAQITADAHSANTSWHDSPAGNYANNTNISLTSPAQNISGGGLGGKEIQFWCHYDLGTGDQWLLEVSSNGGTTWSGSLSFTGTQVNWELWTIGLGPYSHAANFRVRFRLQSNADGVNGDGLYIDDVRIVEGAFGSSLLSDQGLTPAGSVNDQNYLLMNGTSMSTPLTAGAAAIVRQYYTDVVGLSYVSAALLRATLINGATEMSPGQYGVGANREMNARPNSVEGWGRVDLNTALFPTAPAVLDHVDELAGLETGESRTYNLSITNNTVPIVITMVYHDYPGSGIQNNLDMSVTTPGGATLDPNGLAGPDAINNVEQIVIGAPVVGLYNITINGQNVPQGPQPFALVTSGGGTIVTRNPVNVMLVLDKSGSMLDPACPTCSPKLQVLKDAVELFVQLWTAVAVPDDRLGVTYFTTNINEYSVGGEVLLPVLANAAGMIADVQSQTTIPSNLTAMGGGLQSAINRLTDASRPRNIILFTNGMQNVNPMVHQLGGTSLDIEDDATHPHSNIDPTVPPTNLNSALGIKINTIGVGATPPYVDLLDNIATETGGISKLTTAPDEDLRRFYVEELIDVLREFSPQLLGYRHGSLTESNATESFTANDGARKIILKLSWKRGAKLSFQVEKDGHDLTRYGQIINGPFYRIFSIDVPADIKFTIINPGGDWHMRISGTTGASYEAAAIVEEPRLEYDFSLGRKDYVAGDPIELNARLTLGRQPVTDASRVTATVLAPLQGLGTLLSITPTPTEPPGFQFESAATIGQKKLKLLLRDEKFYRDLQPVGNTITLQHKGGGNYSAIFSNTNVTGTYTVIFHVEGDRTDIGKYRRTEIRSTMVRFGKAELDASNIQATLLDKTADGRRMQLRVRPRDRFGNYLGPDYGDRIKVSLSAGSVGSDKRDLADGSYTIPFFVPPTIDPVVTVTVMDQPLLEDHLSVIWKRYIFAVSAHVGRSIPTGNFDNAYDPGLLAELDFGYAFSRSFSLEADLGRYNFDPTYRITGGTLYLKYHRPLNGWGIFAALGSGFYKPENTDAVLGVSAGVGIEKTLWQRLKAELGTYYFHLFLSAGDINFVGLKAGLLYFF